MANQKLDVIYGTSTCVCQPPSKLRYIVKVMEMYSSRKDASLSADFVAQYFFVFFVFVYCLKGKV